MSVRRWSSHRVREGLRSGAWLPGIAALAIGLGLGGQTSAQTLETQPEWQVWVGADVSTHVWLVYSGVTVAPWSEMHENGLRLRAATGYGEYRYRPPGDSGKVRVEKYYADILVGYLQRFGELTAKAFVGASLIGHEPSRHDGYTVLIGDEIGVKGVVELWLNMGERGWGSLDLSWTSAHDTSAARLRTGYRVWPKTSLGIEAALNLDAQAECRLNMPGASGCSPAPGERTSDPLDYARGGVFVRQEWDKGEFSLSVGALGDNFSGRGSSGVAPYVTVNWLTQF